MFTTTTISIDTEQIAVSFRDDLRGRTANQAYPVVTRKKDSIEDESTHCSSSDGDKQVEESPVYKTFAEGGEQHTRGGVNHPNACTPCAFYCFRKTGCPSGENCDYCHKGHESKSRNRREEWKQAQTERRKVKRAAKGDVDKLGDLKKATSCAVDSRDGTSELSVVSPGPQLASETMALNPLEPCYIAIQRGHCALYQEGMTL